jgi:hypothetical protein
MRCDVMRFIPSVVVVVIIIMYACIRSVGGLFEKFLGGSERMVRETRCECSEDDETPVIDSREHDVVSSCTSTKKAVSPRVHGKIKRVTIGSNALFVRLFRRTSQYVVVVVEVLLVPILIVLSIIQVY